MSYERRPRSRTNGSRRRARWRASIAIGCAPLLTGWSVDAVGAGLVPLTLQTGAAPGAIAAADLNRDGKLDLVVANRGSDNVTVFLGRGDGTVAAGNSFATGSSPRAVRAADLDGDGAIDLITANSVDAGLSVLMGVGNGTFGPHTDISIANACDPPCSRPALDVVAQDFNGDGALDLAVAIVGSNVISVVLGRGDGSFEEPIGTAGFVRDDP